MKIFPLILFGVFFIFFGWIVVVRGVLVLLHQHASESFPHVQGTVLYSEVITTHGSKGRVYYHPHIAYQYRVDGMDYRGGRYRYDGHPSDYSSAHEIVAEHPSGSVVNVYYNPQDPTDTVLSTAVDAGDVGLLFFMTPMTLVFLWLFSKAGAQIDWPSNGSPKIGGVKIMTDMMVTRVRLPRYRPLSVTLLVAAILFIIGGILVQSGLTHLPPWVAGQFCLAGVVLGGCAIYAWQFMNVHSGKQDLVIDEGSRTIQLPLNYKRRERTSISFSQVRSVLLNKVRHQTKSGVYYTYMVTLDMTDNTQQKLIDLNQTRAESLGAWLREKLGLSAAVTTQEV